MHFEIPKHLFASLRSFLGEYLMIVVSILTALAIEEVAQYAHRRHGGHLAQEAIETELRANLRDVQGALARNRERSAPFIELDRQLVRDIEVGRTDAEISRDVTPSQRNMIHIGLAWPSLSHEVWDVAVANQTAASIDPAVVRRYTAAYAAQRDLAMSASQGAEMLLGGNRWVDVELDVELGRASPIEMLRMVRQTRTAVASAQASLTHYEERLSRAIDSRGGEGKPAAK